MPVERMDAADMVSAEVLQTDTAALDGDLVVNLSSFWPLRCMSHCEHLGSSELRKDHARIGKIGHGPF